MIVVDTSALVAILAREPSAPACVRIVEGEDHIAISAGTFAECLILANARKIVSEMEDLVAGVKAEIVPVTAVTARRIGMIYTRWGKGFHPAGLNYGDCFAYELAMQRDCPLLFVGEDFARTDVKRAIGF